MFLEHFIIPNEPEGLIAVAVGSVTNVKYFPATKDGVAGISWPENTDVFFGPAVHNACDTTKESVLGTMVLWMDVDNARLPQTTYPPSLTVHSGHGWHLYWVLDSSVQGVDAIEKYTHVLSRDITAADRASWNANRLLRLPGSLNSGDPPKKVVLHSANKLVYKREDFDVLGSLGKKTRHKVRTGDSRGYRSRSERDWAVVVDLVAAGARDELIKILFAHQPVGDKYRDPETAKSYLDKTITEARSKTTQSVSGDFEEREDGYYAHSGRNVKRVSSFTLSPRLLLDAHRFSADDAIVVDVLAMGHRWKDVTFSRQAFTGVARLDRECPVAAWQWLGRDEELRRLLPYLLDQLTEQGMPRVIATPALGLHEVNGMWYFVGDKQTLSADKVWERFTGPIAALPAYRERPSLDLSHQVKDVDIEAVRDILPLLHEPEAIWPLIGWYMASPLKPWFESKGYRFPILNLTGTKGSGKTTLIQRVFMPLLGQVDAKSYDSGTTRFVVLALLGGTNSVPIAFSEFRYATVEKFLRYVLLAYDTGHDPRGRADQTTVDYPLSAPFSIDGEDLVADPAAQERIVAVQLHPKYVEEGSGAYVAYARFNKRRPRFAQYYLQWLLREANEGNLDQALTDARDASFAAIPERVPDRVRNNYTIAFFGIGAFCRASGASNPGFNVLRKSLSILYDPAIGRARTMADDFVEDTINEIATSGVRFKWTYQQSRKEVWFQLSSAHTWWLMQVRRQGRTALEREAIRAQLLESPYTLGTEVVNGSLMYGVSLPKAQESGLDIPGYLNINFGGKS